MGAECTETVNECKRRLTVPVIYLSGKASSNLRMDVYDYRRAHFRAWANELGKDGQAELAKLIGRSDSQVSQLLGRKPMGKKLARALEALRGDPEGSWDLPPPGDSSKVFNENLARLSKAVVPSVQREMGFPKGNPNRNVPLVELDRLAALFQAPPWLLVHPEMKLWDQNRDWLVDMVTTYLHADEEAREHIHSAVKMAKKTMVTAIPA